MGWGGGQPWDIQRGMEMWGREKAHVGCGRGRGGGTGGHLRDTPYGMEMCRHGAIRTQGWGHSGDAVLGMGSQRDPGVVEGDSGGVTVRSLLEILNNQLANGKVQSDQQHSQPHMSCLRPALSCQLAWGASAFHYWKYAINRRGKKSQI